MNSINDSETGSFIKDTVEKCVMQTAVFDVHTHLYDPAFGDQLLWGLDDLLVYHYLVAESFRYHTVPYETFDGLSKSQQADLIWDELFIRHSPISESCRGVLTTLKELGLDPRKDDLNSLRKWFSEQDPVAYIDRCLDIANIEKVCMTNSPFDDLERPIWEKGFVRHERFSAALRLDPLLNEWPQVITQLASFGYSVDADLSGSSIDEIRRFLSDWIKKIEAQYLMVSFPSDFQYPENSIRSRLLESVVLPVCREFGLPFAVMLGVRRSVNPDLGLAGDGLGKSDLRTLESLCCAFPENRFLATLLARENQHELAVLARKFRNLHIFGCWWFMNIPELIDEITRMRVELLGLSFTPQHSDARVLDQVIYKWKHSRRIIADILKDKYQDLHESGWTPTEDEIKRDVKGLFGGQFKTFCKP